MLKSTSLFAALAATVILAGPASAD
ncbi:MAG: hypothetical protein JWR79_276, partial [Tardiphaga sp.]|nr:hypothetical protein [Tardiphaga sp.]